jgi:uncharacterized protein (TIGR02466 family)
MINRHIELTTIVKVDIMKGKSFADLNTLKDILLKESDNRLSEDSYDTRYEDTYCPAHPIVDEIINEMILDFKEATNEEYWGHIHEKNMSTNTHNHGDSYVSSVIYLSVPNGSGNLVLIPKIDKRDDHAYRKICEPIEGYYYLFPSYLDHYVTRNKSEEKRVSMSFNFTKV